MRCCRPAASISVRVGSSIPEGANTFTGVRLSTTPSAGGELHAQPQSGQKKKRQSVSISLAKKSASPQTGQSLAPYRVAETISLLDRARSLLLTSEDSAEPTHAGCHLRILPALQR